MKPISKLFVSLAAMLVFLLSSSMGFADGRPWKDHKKPYTFLFGNHIDTHQETRLTNTGDLQGFFYITWLDKVPEGGDGIIDIDEASGLPVAGHCNKPEHYEAGCFAGWHIRAKPCIEEVNGCRAMYLFHYHDHPPWLLDPTVDSEGGLRGSRLNIVQPGSFTHMHWLTESSTHKDTFLPSSLEEVEEFFGVDITVPAECNVAMAKALTTGAICPGYFLEIKAVKSFAFSHGGEKIPVRPGLDNKTHLNLLTTFVEGVDIPDDVVNGLPAHGGGHGDEGDSGGSGGGDHGGGGGH